MATCKDCLHFEVCEQWYTDDVLSEHNAENDCDTFKDPKRYVVLEKPQTNADRIRAMSDEELADFLAGIIVKESLLRLKDEGCLLTEIREKALRHQLFLTVAQFLKEPVKDGEDDG